MNTHILGSVVSGLAIIATAACGNNSASNGRAPNRTAADRQLGGSATPITVTGCLQQDGRTYIVTHLNEPSREGVGTSGNADAVEREQLRQAANAYRVESKDRSDWDGMVGKQVRVSGTIDKAADLPEPSGVTPSGSDASSANSASAAAGIGTAGGGSAPRENIDKGDLARLAVQSMTVVAENCGGK